MKKLLITIPIIALLLLTGCFDFLPEEPNQCEDLDPESTNWQYYGIVRESELLPPGEKDIFLISQAVESCKKTYVALYGDIDGVDHKANLKIYDSRDVLIYETSHRTYTEEYAGMFPYNHEDGWRAVIENTGTTEINYEFTITIYDWVDIDG